MSLQTQNTWEDSSMQKYLQGKFDRIQIVADSQEPLPNNMATGLGEGREIYRPSDKWPMSSNFFFLL